jgi:DNA-binding NtrC family response regulator
MQSLKVLILEDHPFQLMALHQMLNANRVYDVLTAESVESAYGSLERRGRVDIAICDLQMLDADGLALIRHLASEGLAGALIILGGAERNVLDSVSQLAQQLGLRVLGCLQKPACAGSLRKLLEQYLHEMPETREVATAPQHAGVPDLQTSHPEQLDHTVAQ